MKRFIGYPYIKIMNELERAKKILDDNGYTCVVIKGDETFISKERGVKPLLSWLDDKVDLKDAIAADKVVGKAAAFLYVLLKIKSLYAHIISVPAYEILVKYGVQVSFGEKVSAIRNRDKSGFCPMETAVWNVDEPNEAYNAVVEKIKQLANK